MLRVLQYPLQSIHRDLVSVLFFPLPNRILRLASHFGGE